MKKIILLFVIFSSFIATSQVKLKPGVKAGLNLANITNTDFDVKPDFYAGIKLGIQFSERYTLQPELLYSRQGARPQLDGGSNSEIQIDYFSVGIVNKFLLFKNINLHTVVGPFFDFKVSDNIDYDPYLNIFENLDIGFLAGLDYEFSSGLGLELRYKLGLNDLGGIDVTNVKQLTNKVFQFGLSYNFSF